MWYDGNGNWQNNDGYTHFLISASAGTALRGGGTTTVRDAELATKSRQGACFFLCHFLVDVHIDDLRRTLFAIMALPEIKRSLAGIPLLSGQVGPRHEKWKDRCALELKSLIKYLKSNKEQDKDWFTIK